MSKQRKFAAATIVVGLLASLPLGIPFGSNDEDVSPAGASETEPRTAPLVAEANVPEADDLGTGDSDTSQESADAPSIVGEVAEVVDVPLPSEPDSVDIDDDPTSSIPAPAPVPAPVPAETVAATPEETPSDERDVDNDLPADDGDDDRDGDRDDDGDDDRDGSRGHRGRSAEAPGHTGEAPGLSGETPGQSGHAPGRHGGTPEGSAEAPGRAVSRNDNA